MYSVLSWLSTFGEKYSISKQVYERIISDRGAEPTDSKNIINIISLDLMKADLYMEMFTHPSQYTRSMTDIGFSQSESGQNAYKDNFYKMAMDIYKKYGDDKFIDISGSIKPIQIKNNW